MIEDKDTALFIVKIPGIAGALKFHEALESSGGKDWVRLRLRPAQSRLKETPKFKSAFIGEVKVRKGAEEGELDILFELLPAKVKYSIKKAEDSLIVSITPL